MDRLWIFHILARGFICWRFTTNNCGSAKR